MSKTAMIRARIEPELKAKGEKALKAMGLTPTQAITIFYKQITIQKAIPFEVKLEAGDIPENYIRVKNKEHLAELIGLKDVQTEHKSGSKKIIKQSSRKHSKKSYDFSKSSN